MSTSSRFGVRVLIFVFLLIGTSSLSAEQPTWKIGLSGTRITPKKPMWMSGYGPRLASSVLHDIWTKVLAIESPGGDRAVVVTADVCGFSKLSYDAIFAELHKRCGLERSQFMLTCSHTHTGPALRECLHVCWPWNDPQARALVEEYSLDLEQTIVEKVIEALGQMTPATLWATEGSAAFAVNRRNNPEEEVPRIRQRGEPLKGPVDHSIPILAARAPDGRLRAVLFGYACHSTTLASTEWSGDYAGFAMLALERNHPDAQVLFYQGCGADQNPLPRRSVELCRQYGEMLAAGVEAALRQPMRPLAPRLRTAFDYVDLPYERNPTVAELEASVRDGGVMGGLSKRFLDQLAAGKPFASYPYPVQVWKLGDDQLWISLAGEVVVDYSLKFKAKYGPTTWTSGFTQEMVCYIPSLRVLKEGFGQEVGSPRSYGLPAYGWTAEVEDRVTAGVERLVDEVK
ncbi:MAG: hypothetical protein NTW96_26115 [Planctomycetia bacterium]|nr:hypothetical protein [Planctomycetia bacterium]